MRGKVSFYRMAMNHARITPAYAGKSFKQYHHHTTIQGSPPRMRGKVSLGGIKAELGSITPAYAGKSPGCVFSLATDVDHPRVCGEKFLPL